MTRTNVGVALIVVAIALGLVGLRLWNRESDRVERETTVSEFRQAIEIDSGNPYARLDEPEANRAPVIGAWGVGGVLFLSGVIVLSAAPRDEVTS